MRLAVLLLAALLSASLAVTASAQSLEQAYQTELKVLRSERKELQRTLQETEETSAAARVALERDIEALSSELAQLRVDNTGQSAQRPGPVEQAEQTQLIQLRDQLEATAVTMHLPVPPVEADQLPAVRLEVLISASLQQLSKQAGLRIARSVEVFDAQGVARKADVLRVGEVGAVHWSGRHAALVRTLDGSLRTMQGVSGDVAATGDGRAVTAVLFDPKRPPAPKQYVKQDTWSKLEAGGLLMWPLLAMALVLVLVALERALVLAAAARQGEKLRSALDDWRPPEVGVSRAPQSVNARHWLATPAVRVVEGVGTPRADLEDQAVQDLAGVRARLSRRLTVLAVTAAAAPLIGLLGTVTGMITTFSVITEHGTGDPQLFAGGISEALLTTQLGLAVAIPALLIHSGLSRWANRLAEANVDLVSALVLRVGGAPERASAVPDARSGDGDA